MEQNSQEDKGLDFRRVEEELRTMDAEEFEIHGFQLTFLKKKHKGTLRTWILLMLLQ
jgi:hypothetical protein